MARAATYLTRVLVNHGSSPMEGTAESMRGWDLMNCKVSSGNSMEVLKDSAWPCPEQQPGLKRWEVDNAPKNKFVPTVHYFVPKWCILYTEFSSQTYSLNLFEIVTAVRPSPWLGQSVFRERCPNWVWCFLLLKSSSKHFLDVCHWESADCRARYAVNVDETQ